MTSRTSPANLVAMLGKVLSPRQRLQIREVIVDWVAVPVVNDAPRGCRAIHGLPDHDGSKTPSVRLGDLNPRAHNTTMLAVTNGPNRKPIHRPHARGELGCRGSVLTLPGRLKPHIGFGATSARAVVHVKQLGRLALERLFAHRARAFNGGVVRLPARHEGLSPCDLAPLRTEARSLPAVSRHLVTSGAPLADAYLRRHRKLFPQFRRANPMKTFYQFSSISGSGTTLEALLVEGFLALDIEPCRMRLSRPIQPVLNFEEAS